MPQTTKTTKTTKRTAKNPGRKNTGAKATKEVKAKSKAKSVGSVSGTHRDHDLPWNDKKVAIFKALKALKATTKGDARSSKDIAEKADVSQQNVRHYGYHAMAGGLIAIADVEGSRGHGFYLTAKGKNVNPERELKQQTAVKK